MVQHKKILDAKFLQTSVSFSWRCNPMLRLVCSSTCDIVLFLGQVHRIINDINWIASRGDLVFAKYLWWFSPIQCSMSLNIDKNMTLPLEPHGSVDPKNTWIHLVMWIAVWPEIMCQWNCTGLSVISHLSITVDESHISEMCADAWFAMALLFPTHKTESENTETFVLNTLLPPPKCPFSKNNSWTNGHSC